MKRKVNQNSLKNLSIGRPVKVIDEETLLSLRSRGWSVGRLANKFSCSRETIRARLKKVQPKKKDEKTMNFALAIENMSKDLEDDFCRREVRRLVRILRTRASLSDEDKKTMILKSFHSPDIPKDIFEIAEDCGFYKEETAKLLTELVAENRLEARPRGGIYNRGRKMKYNYFLI